MADVGGKVNVNNERAVCKIHEALKGKIHELAGKKSWSSKQKEDFEKRLTEFYKETVEETVKKNVCIAGKDWVDPEGEGDSSADAVEPLDREKLEGLNQHWAECEDLIRLCSQRRKHHPAEMKQALSNTLQCQKAIAESFQPTIRSDAVAPESVPFNREDAEKAIHRLQDVVADISTFSKAFPELQGKTDRLLQAVQSHGAMQECETDAVLFGKESMRQRHRLRSASRTPTVSDVVHSLDVKSRSVRSTRQSGAKRKSRQ